MPGSTPGQVSGDDLQLVEDKTLELVKEHNAFRANQFDRWSNAKAHYQGTAPEIWEQSLRTVTAFCDFVGTGGTFAGCAQFFKERQDQEDGANKKIECVVVEPTGAAILAGQDIVRPNHRIQGGGYLMEDLPMLQNNKIRNRTTQAAINANDVDDDASHDETLADRYLQVSDEEAIAVTRDLAKYEGIFGGYSAGANAAAAIQLLKTSQKKNGVVAILICDSGLKYLSTGLWEN